MSAWDSGAGGAVTEDGRLTTNSATAIFTATGATWIRSITAAERSGATPTLSIEKYDPVNAVSYYMRFAVSMTAGSLVVYNEPFSLPLGWQIRMTSGNASGLVDWSITYEAPAAAKLR